jgi:hypothetical protein
MKEAFIILEKAAKEIHLQVKQEKIHVNNQNDYRHRPPCIETGPFKCENIHCFTYLGSQVNGENSIRYDIKTYSLCK